MAESFAVAQTDNCLNLTFLSYISQRYIRNLAPWDLNNTHTNPYYIPVKALCFLHYSHKLWDRSLFYFISGSSFHASFPLSKSHLCPTSTIHFLQNGGLTMKLGHHPGCACIAKPSPWIQRHFPDDTKSSDRIKICNPEKSSEWLPWEFLGHGIGKDSWKGDEWLLQSSLSPPGLSIFVAFAFAPPLACCTQFCPGTADLFLT